MLWTLVFKAFNTRLRREAAMMEAVQAAELVAAGRVELELMRSVSALTPQRR